MSRTDKTRPWSVIVSDPLNNRFKMVGRFAYPTDGVDEWYYKRLKSTSCHCCGPSKYLKKAKRSARNRWIRDRQYALSLADKSDVDILPEKFRE